MTKKTKISKLREMIPETVGGMWVGLIIFALACELVGIWFVKDKAGYSVGILLGTLLSGVCVYHMWYTLDKSADFADEKSAGKYLGSRYIIRYAALIALVLILYFTGIGNPFSAFLAYMGMKPAAYMQPALHRLAEKRR